MWNEHSRWKEPVSVQAEASESMRAGGNARTGFRVWNVEWGAGRRRDKRIRICLCRKPGFHPARNEQELKVFKMSNGISKSMFRNKYSQKGRHLCKRIDRTVLK